MMVSWNGCVRTRGGTLSSDGLSCTFDMTADRNIFATFSPTGGTVPLTLRTSAASTGTGTFNCGNANTSCAPGYRAGSQLLIIASGDPGSEFDRWVSGCTPVSGKPNECTLTIGDTGSSVTASFIALRALQAITDGTGAGSVSFRANSADLTSANCPGISKCKQVIVRHNTDVTITARPADSNSEFGGWTGACSTRGRQPTCTLGMDAAKSVTATFNRLHTLTAARNGTGTGTIKVKVPNQTDKICSDARCDYPFAQGTRITLSAEGADAVFDKWSVNGAPTLTCPGTGDCTIELDKARTVTATFNLPQGTHQLTLNKTGNGSVTVKALNQLDRTCAATATTCRYSFNALTRVTLIAQTTDVTFNGWPLGDCAESPNRFTCVVAMTGAKTVTASFGPPQGTYALDASPTTGSTGTGSFTCRVGPATATAGACGLYAKDTQVTVIASANPGSQFDGWTGCTAIPATPNQCTVTIGTADKIVSARFTAAPATYQLTVSKTGNGSVKCNNAGCQSSYAADAQVTLTAFPAQGSVFLGWSGDLPQNSCVDTGPCTVTMTQARNVTAKFGAGVALSYRTSGDGSGELLAGGQVLCARSCTLAYPSGTRISLTARAAPGSLFVGWSGQCSGTGVCSLRMRGARNVTANFVKIVNHDLTIARNGSGSGSVLVSGGASQTCSSSLCTYSYGAGTSVTLTAKPQPGSVFIGWSENCAGTGTCSMKMSGARRATATFARIVSHELTITRDGNGSGSVSVSAGARHSCSAPSCTYSYNTGTIVTLTANPQPGSNFAGWPSPCSATSRTCILTMTEAMNVRARFTKPASFTLALAINGTGTVKLSAPGYRNARCSGGCTRSYLEGTKVTLSATTQRGWVFQGWSAGELCTGPSLFCTVPMSEVRNVTATFRQVGRASILGGMQ